MDYKLEKIDQFRFLLPRTGGMRVPGIIYSSEAMLAKVTADRAPEQVANVAHLPGILRYSLAMPDIHWGYGAPIGGVAAFDLKEGVAVPGIVGYDINCISGDTQILSEFGYTLKISDYEKVWPEEKLTCINLNDHVPNDTGIRRFLKSKPRENVYRLKTDSGFNIIATGDHPFYTRDGMKPFNRLNLNDELAVYPFRGVSYERPSSEIILNEEMVRRKLEEMGKTGGNAAVQIINRLKEKNLLPLKYSSSALPILLKLMGYIFGDGNVHFESQGDKGVISFYGGEEDLKKIKEDLISLGYKSSRIYQRVRNHEIVTHYKTYKFQRVENSYVLGSTSLAVFFSLLGVPIGNKTFINYAVPSWIFGCTLWQKRLFLAAFFGAEMSKPKTVTGHGYNFYGPAISMNKREGYVENGKKFLKGVSGLLKEFGVATRKISHRIEYVGKSRRKSCRLRLLVSSEPENLINLYSKVGFEYNRQRSFLANAAILYLTEKKKAVSERERIATRILSLKGKGLSARKIYAGLSPAEKKSVNLRFIERTIYENRETPPRIAFNFEKFGDFVKSRTSGLGLSGMAWDRLSAIEKIDFDDYVYDFTVCHHDHNFIANNFVVSNCGVRLLRTNLRKEEITGKLKELVDGLYRAIPCGVGGTGRLKLSRTQLSEVLETGAVWAVKAGYGKESDLAVIEETGRYGLANPDKLSSRAYERGSDQLGTLGSGNHFVEIQEVKRIFDPEIAGVFGLSPGQITVMVHTGSRGLGYQVADDYLSLFSKVSQKYGVFPPDRQLVCAPISSGEGQGYLGAMASAANFAWANRQVIAYWINETFGKLLGKSAEELGLATVYDVAHNIAKMEEHQFEGKRMKVLVHRKGATRAFPANVPGVPDIYASVGQPVLIPGTMGTSSYVLVGTEKALSETWGSTCHGAGRNLSRHEAVKKMQGRSAVAEMASLGILARAPSLRGLAEEVPEAYKDVDQVVEVVEGSGLSRRVCQMVPLAVIKG
ncbi:MAG: intein-containing RctB family protein [Candidatus Omnitrophota bacterium]